MNAGTIIVAAIAGIVAGWLASFIVGGGSLLKYLVWGVLGSFVGGVLVPMTGFSINTGMPIVDTIIISAIGAVVLVLIARLIA